MRWLDAQPERSVLYAAFGSEAPLTPAHVREGWTWPGCASSGRSGRPQ
jgi:hypothetical protein